MKLITVDAEKYRNKGDEFYDELYAQLKGSMTDVQFADAMNAVAREHGLREWKPASWASMFRTHRYSQNDEARKVLLLAGDDIELPPTGHEIVDTMIDPNAAWFSMLPNGSTMTSEFPAPSVLGCQRAELSS